MSNYPDSLTEAATTSLSIQRAVGSTHWHSVVSLRLCSFRQRHPFLPCQGSSRKILQKKSLEKGLLASEVVPYFVWTFKVIFSGCKHFFCSQPLLLLVHLKTCICTNHHPKPSFSPSTSKNIPVLLASPLLNSAELRRSQNSLRQNPFAADLFVVPRIFFPLHHPNPTHAYHTHYFVTLWVPVQQFTRQNLCAAP